MPAPAFASSDPLRTYVQARAAGIGGDHRRAAELLTALSQSQPGQAEIAKRAFAEALGSGQYDLAMSMARGIPTDQMTSDARLLLAADEVKRHRAANAVQWLSVKGDAGDLSFMAPLVLAWDAAERGQQQQALSALDQIASNSLLTPIAAEERAFILLKFERAADAEPYARRAVGSAGARENRLRLAFADGFLAAGDKPRALMILEGMGGGGNAARARVQAGQMSGEAIDTGAKAYSEALVAFAADLARMQRTLPPIGLVQVARFCDPQNSSAVALLSLLLDRQGRTNEALALLASVSPNDALISPIRDVQARILIDKKRLTEAYNIAAPPAFASAADQYDFSRLAEVYAAMKQYARAADAYGKAIALTNATGPKTDLWSLHLLQASAYQDANRWADSKASLAQGLALAPDQPLLLNFLGYSKLEHGEDVAGAEAMIRKASELAPDDASITDSLGWAQFKLGKTSEAISTLQSAAEKDPAQAEIQEHLGDALFKAGRRYEARYAWSAAVATVEDDEMAARLQAKLAGGLTPANAAP